MHIQPINNGGVLSSVAYICSKYKLLDAPNCPRDFLEMISVDNFCKFSISTRDHERKANVDYAGDSCKLEYSLDYVRRDLTTLSPDYIFMPDATYKHVKRIIHEILPNTVVIPMRQLTSTVVNCHIAPKVSYEDIESIRQSTPFHLLKWVEEVSISGLKKNGMYMFISDLLKRTESAIG